MPSINTNLFVAEHHLAAKVVNIRSSELATGIVSPQTSLVSFMGHGRLVDNIGFNRNMLPGIAVGQAMLGISSNAVKRIADLLGGARNYINMATGNSNDYRMLNNSFNGNINQIFSIIRNTKYSSQKLLMSDQDLQNGQLGVTNGQNNNAAIATAQTAVKGAETDLLDANTALVVAQGANLAGDLAHVEFSVNTIHNNLTINYNIFTVNDNPMITILWNNTIGHVLSDCLNALAGADHVTLQGLITAMDNAKAQLDLHKGDTAANPNLANFTLLRDNLTNYIDSINAVANNANVVVYANQATNSVDFVGTLYNDTNAGSNPAAFTAAALSTQINNIRQWLEDLDLGTTITDAETRITNAKAAVANAQLALQVAQEKLNALVAAPPPVPPGMAGMMRMTYNLAANDMLAINRALIKPVRTSSSPDPKQSFILKIPGMDSLLRPYAIAAPGTSIENSDNGLDGAGISDNMQNNALLEHKIERILSYVNSTLYFLAIQSSHLQTIEKGIVADNANLEQVKLAYMVDYTTAGGELQQAITLSKVASTMAMIQMQLMKNIVNIVQTIADNLG